MKLINCFGFIILLTLTLPVLSQKNNYDFSCFEEDVFDVFLGVTTDLEKNILNGLNSVAVSLDDEIKVGNEVLNNEKKKYKFLYNEQYNELKEITKRLSKNIPNPRGFNYEIFLLDSEQIFAYTIGGKIFFSTGLYKFTSDIDVISAILGHEIAHNELLHLNDAIKRLWIANQISYIGDYVAVAGKIMTIALNQKDEIHCDFYGVDLAFNAGYTPCKLPAFWEKLNKVSSAYEGVFKFISSHPNPLKRKECVKNHIFINYKEICI
jgi:predicted Zn-dependent protease